MTTLRTIILCSLFALPAWAADADPAALVLTDITGKTHKPANTKGARIAVYFYVSTDCPIANFYQPTMRKLAAKFAKQGVLFFQVHPDPDTSVETATKHAREFEVTVPVIIDKKQELTRRHRARVTPEAIVVTRSGEIVYRGRIDDTYATYGKRRPEPTSRDLESALTATLAGRKVDVPVTEPVGCKIFLESE